MILSSELLNSCLEISVLESSAHAYALNPVVGLGQGSAGITPMEGFTTGSSSRFYGGGLLADFQISRGAEVEVGILYMPRGYTTISTGQTAVATSLTTLQMPVLFKARALPFLTLNFGGYYSRGIGSVSVGSVTESYGVSLKEDSFGAAFGLSVETRIIPYLNITLHGRYLMDLQNSSAVPGQTTLLNDLQLLVGLRFDY